MRFSFLIVFIFLFKFTSYSQVIDYDHEFEGFGLLYSGEGSPFWLHTNTKGRVDEKTNLSALLKSKANISVNENSYFEIGAGGLYKNGFEDGFFLDEAYFALIGKKAGVVVGKKHKEDFFQGLSASNENILWSLNAPAVPGLRFFTPEPWFINEDHGLGFMVSLEEYLLDDERYIKDTWLHHKSFHLVYQNERNFRIALGVQHYVQWAGISEEFGKLPNSFEDYISVITGRASDESVGGQEVNALGNQIGSYELKLKTKIHDLDFQFLYNHIFEDASGMKMGNFPDGRYAFYIEDNRDSFWGTPWLTAFMYEFYYTKNQSRDRMSSNVDGADNYFNNNLYRSGWTYRNHIIGVPFILLNEDRFRIGTNILTVHHLGLKGRILDEIPYRFLLSYRKNYGRKDSFFPETREVFSNMLELELINSDYLLKAQLGVDINSFEKSNFGIGLNFSKTIF